MTIQYFRGDNRDNVEVLARKINEIIDALNAGTGTISTITSTDLSVTVTNPTGPIVDLAAAGSSPIFQHTTNISSAQLLALDSTPVELLPAPGGRNYYVIHGLVLHYRFVTTPYNESARFSLQVGYGATLADIDANTGPGAFAAPLNFGTSTGNFFKSTDDAYILPTGSLDDGNLFGYIWTKSAVENKAFIIGINGSPLTGGDATLTVRIFYSTIDGTP